MAGIFVIGKYKPPRKSIGNLKKFDKVCASNTSLTDTATNNPRNADVSAIKNTLRKTINQSIPLSEEAQNNDYIVQIGNDGSYGIFPLKAKCQIDHDAHDHHA